MTTKAKIVTTFLILGNLLIIAVFVFLVFGDNISSLKDFNLGKIKNMIEVLGNHNSTSQNTGSISGTEVTKEGLKKRFTDNLNLEKTQTDVLGNLDQAKLDILIYHRDLKPWPDGISPYVKGKVIEVNLTTQRFYRWENGNLLSDWLTSTGKPDKPTKKGIFKIQTKMPYAEGHDRETGQYWGMPWWMGVYCTGGGEVNTPQCGIENGIHALPLLGESRVKEGLWDLGRQVSHGCIRLSDTNAKIAYDWADLGTPVIIHY